MANQRHSDQKPEPTEAASDPNLRERVEALKEKVSGLTETLGNIENTLKEES